MQNVCVCVRMRVLFFPRLTIITLVCHCVCTYNALDHGGAVRCHPGHPGGHDAPHPLCEDRPRVAAAHRLAGRPAVVQLRLRAREHHLHRDEQDQGHCHQRSHLHGGELLLWFILYFKNILCFKSIEKKISLVSDVYF